jgi:multisubunit Na+/H+ antiporter MnhB subunit
MTETKRPRRTLRSIGAVFAGLLFIFIVTTIVDVVLHETGVFPPWQQRMSDALFGVATAYRIIISIAGCYLAARLAPDRPMGHALTLGAIGVVISAIGAAVTWNKGPEFGPHWYPLLLIVVSIPCAWIGGRMFERRRTA